MTRGEPSKVIKKKQNSDVLIVTKADKDDSLCISGYKKYHKTYNKVGLSG